VLLCERLNSDLLRFTGRHSSAPFPRSALLNTYSSKSPPANSQDNGGRVDFGNHSLVENLRQSPAPRWNALRVFRFPSLAESHGYPRFVIDRLLLKNHQVVKTTAPAVFRSKSIGGSSLPGTSFQTVPGDRPSLRHRVAALLTAVLVANPTPSVRQGVSRLHHEAIAATSPSRTRASRPAIARS